MVAQHTNALYKHIWGPQMNQLAKDHKFATLDHLLNADLTEVRILPASKKLVQH